MAEPNFEEKMAESKILLFAAMRGAGIASIQLNYDGSGDSGCIESATAYDGSEREMKGALRHETGLLPPLIEERYRAKGCLQLREVIESLGYAILEDRHPGWEINEGSQGTMTFDAVAGLITLDHGENEMTTVDFHHEF